MSVASRPVSTGKTRTCPHCKATILESLSICPGCMHHLRFDSEAAKRQVAAAPALRVEGIIRHPPNEQPLEYFVIIAIRNDRGEEVTRQVVNVGALQAAEKRTFTMSVEVLPPSAPVPPQKQNTPVTSSTGAGTFKPPAPQPSAAQARTVAAPPTAPSSGASAPPSAAPPGTAAPRAAGPGTAASKGPTPAVKPPPTPPGTVSTPGSAGSSSSAANPPPNPAAPAKPSSGYVLKPPSPGGPKRH